MPNTLPLLMSPALAANYLGVSRSKLLKLLLARRIEAKLIDGRRFFTSESLRRFAASLPDA